MHAFLSRIFNLLKLLWRFVAERFGKGDSGLEDPSGIEVVDYYGCPNSKKAQKLQLKQNIYR